MTVSVDAVVYFRISNPFISVVNVENASGSTRLLAQTTLRNILGTKNLAELLSEREEISGSMQVNGIHSYIRTYQTGVYDCNRYIWMNSSESLHHFRLSIFSLVDRKKCIEV